MSINDWKSVLKSERAWEHIRKEYSITATESLDGNAFDAFKVEAEKALSEFYYSMSVELNDNSIYSAFSEVFKIHSDRFFSEALEPILALLEDTANEFENTIESSDWETYIPLRYDTSPAKGTFLTERKRKLVYDQCESLVINTRKIMEFGQEVWNTSKGIIVRDRIATALRGTGIEIFNNLTSNENTLDHDLVIHLLNTADSIVGTNTLKVKILNDFTDIERIKEKGKWFSEIEGLIKTNKISEAREKIEEMLRIEDDDSAIKVLKEYRSYCFTNADLDGLQPIDTVPSLGTTNGFGITMYGESLAIVLLFIPFFWLGRYAVNMTGFKEGWRTSTTSYDFRGKKKLAKWQIIWNICFASGIIVILGFLFRFW